MPNNTADLQLPIFFCASVQHTLTTAIYHTPTLQFSRVGVAKETKTEKQKVREQKDTIKHKTAK